MGSSLWIFILTIMTILVIFGITAILAQKTINVKPIEKPKDDGPPTRETEEELDKLVTVEDPELIVDLPEEDDDMMSKDLVEEFKNYGSYNSNLGHL